MVENQIPTEIDSRTGLPIGPKVARSHPAQRPERVVLEGRYCRLEPLEAGRHGEALFKAATPPDAERRHRYLPDRAPRLMGEFELWLKHAEQSNDPLYFAVIDRRSGSVQGRQTLMRITPEHQVIEIGHIYWGPAISRTPVTTEANFLFAEYIFEQLGYRRYEWKCDALNSPSRQAALRFGFRYEGLFRRAVIVRGRTRDTAWYSIIEEEWPALKAIYQRWLDPSNFTVDGQQRTALSAMTAL